MIYRAEYLKDTIGTNYVGININLDLVNPFLDKLKNLLFLPNFHFERAFSRQGFSVTSFFG